MYQVRRVNIGKTDQLDELARECGRLYSQTLVFFWRTVRHKGIWLKPKHLMRLFTSKKLHAHTADACVQAFFASLKSWRDRKKLGDPGKVAGVDLGEVHLAVSHDGEHTHILNGRYLRSKVQYRNKLQAKLNSRIDGRMKKGSRQRKKLIASKKRQLKKIEHQIKDIEHQQTTRLISTLHENGVQTVVIGDARDIRKDNDVGHTNNQKIHQWSHGSVRFKLTYKAERLCMYVALQDEHYTSRTCPRCRYVRSRVKGRVFGCPKCGWTYHRDGVGSINIRQKYLGSFPVVGAMAPPIGIRYKPRAGVAQSEKG
jgi:putative transposase